MMFTELKKHKEGDRTLWGLDFNGQGLDYFSRMLGWSSLKLFLSSLLSPDRTKIFVGAW